ncbi:MAG TPA: hypothetical protein ENN46_00820 [Candidatus Woesearchaeota archaeon]|mgnify:CR=1 FL=1|nr:hypothetical protein [Candidatus Woesearchaeota archaeon]
MEKVAVVLIRSRIGTDIRIKDALDRLSLRKKMVCSVFDKSPSLMGMLERVKDYATYGEISDETFKLLSEKRKDRKAGSGSKSSVFFLAPPKGGFERKGIKVPFSNGGVLGYRKEKMNDLILKMI